MALAVKNPPEVGSTGPQLSTQGLSLLGTVYLIVSLGVVFKLLPSLWGTPSGFQSGVLLALVMVGALAGLAYLGARLLGDNPPRGVRAGIFLAFVGLLGILLLTRWVSTWFESWVYDSAWMSPVVGISCTAVFGLLLLYWYFRWFLRPTTEKTLTNFESQGWFSATSYKPLQGLRVRRGTMIGLLLLVAAGVYSLLIHNTLERGPKDWVINVPFTARVLVDIRGEQGADFRAAITDNSDPKAPTFKSGVTNVGDDKVLVDRLLFKEINDRLNPDVFVKIKTPEQADRYGEGFENGAIIKKDDFKARFDSLKEENRLDPKADFERDFVQPKPVKGDLHYLQTIPVLPAVKYALPFVLIALALWLSWRIVNLPTFADFLIATEAELNKVSWTSRRRLYQDTIVVLVTVLLMAIFLFFMDQIWRILLTFLRVLQFSDAPQDGVPLP
jgi:preprotein translocase SecE subunit